MKTVRELMGLDEAEKMKGEDPCWDTHQMVGMKMKNGRKVPNCVPKAKAKNEEVELDEEQHSVLFKMKKDAPKISVAHYKSKEDAHKFLQSVKDKGGNGIIRSKTNEEVEDVSEGGIIKSIKRALHGWDKKAVGPGGEKLGDPRDIVKRAKAMDIDTAKKVRSGLDGASDHSPAGLQKRVLDRKLKGVAEETEQIDELNKDTVYSYNKKADADIEKKHKSLGQLMRKSDAAGANKAAHQINRRLAGMERAEKRLNKEEVEIEEAKKTTPNAKPVDPKNLVVSLKDVPVKKPRGHTQYDPSKEFPGVKSLKREEVELDEEAPPIQVRSSYVQAYAKHHKTGKKPSDAVAAAYEDVAKKHGYDMVKKLKAHHAANEQVETAAQVTKHFEKGQSTSTGVPKWVATVVKAKKKLQKEQADKELMNAQPSGGKKLAAKFEKAFKAMGQPRKVNCMTVGQVSSCEETEHEFNDMFTEAMKKKPEASSKQTLKKGEKLSGKQEPVTISPEIEKKGVA